MYITPKQKQSPNNKAMKSDSPDSCGSDWDVCDGSAAAAAASLTSWCCFWPSSSSSSVTCCSESVVFVEASTLTGISFQLSHSLLRMSSSCISNVYTLSVSKSSTVIYNYFTVSFRPAAAFTTLRQYTCVVFLYESVNTENIKTISLLSRKTQIDIESEIHWFTWLSGHFWSSSESSAKPIRTL